MIEFSSVSKAYGDSVVLGPVSGTIQAGGITALVGANGAGKSTLLTIMGRLLAPTTGTVTINGLDVQKAKSRDLAKVVSILRQENHLPARLTVRQLVALGRFPHSQGRLTADCHEHIDRAIDFLNLRSMADRYLDEMSGGQRQRAFVAMVLAQDTDYLLLDEPLNNLDMRHAVLMMKQLRRAADELGKTVVIILHDLNFASAYADHIIALSDGQIAATGSPAEIMQGDLLTEVFSTAVSVHRVAGCPTAFYYR